jgi:hypothetical protein
LTFNITSSETARLEYCPTEEIVADGLTKALGKASELGKMMGMGVWKETKEE